MFASFIITLRETLEAALVVGIVISYLIHTGNRNYIKDVWIAVGAGLFFSVIAAFMIDKLGGSFEGTGEEIYEGITMLAGAALLTTMIFWMMKQGNVTSGLQEKMQIHLDKGQRWGIFLLILFSVIREGIETVIFLSAASFTTDGVSWITSSGGIIIAVVLGYLLFRSTVKINLRLFFRFTNILLILFAAGLVAHGVHELQEAKVIPTVVEHVWDINPPVKSENTYPVMHEKGHIGSLFQGLFGYNGNPSLIEIISYLLYVVFVIYMWKRVSVR